jgi:5'(3')-deoxyribonucleotidase
MERQPYRFSELFTGNWELFEKAVRSPETVFVYDNDGIISDTSKEVFKRFNQEYGVSAKTSDISKWSYLTEYAKERGMSKEAVDHAEGYFYDPDVLEKAQDNLYIKPVINKTLSYYGPERNFILTSRNPEFKDVTLSWFKAKFPGIIPENILMRDDNDHSTVEDFKIRKLREIASSAPWIVFVDDGLKFVQAAVEADIPNCLVVNIPQGKTKPDFAHEHLFVINRYPDELQAVYPFMDALDRALRNGKSP